MADIVFEKEFEIELPVLQNGEAKLVSGLKHNYLVTREGDLFRIYVQSRIYVQPTPKP